MLTAFRYHDFSCAHRSPGDPGRCGNIHGHNYRAHFTCSADTVSALGRVVDFAVIKDVLCGWIESNWDHKLLLWDKDPLWQEWQSWEFQRGHLGVGGNSEWFNVLSRSIVKVSFNTSTEFMANWLLAAGNTMLPHPVMLTSVRIEETRKCGAEASLTASTLIELD